MNKQLLSQDDYEINRKKKIRHTIRTTPEEEEAIQKRRAGTNLTFNEFMVHMAILGIYVKQDFESIRELSNELNKIGVNINQIAHKANESNYVTKEDIKYLKNQIEKMWKAINDMIKVNKKGK